jgi:hypothetical protein
MSTDGLFRRLPRHEPQYTPVEPLEWAVLLVIVGIALWWGSDVGGVPGAVAAVFGFGVATMSLLVAHEAAHLVVALALRLPVQAVRVFDYTFYRQPRSAVQAWPGWGGVLIDVDRASRRHLALRMAVCAAAGPAVHVGLTLVAFHYATRVGLTMTIRCGFIGAAVAGAAETVANMVPTSSGHGHSDGANVMKWLCGGSRLCDEVALASVELAIMQADAGGLDLLRDRLVDPRPRIAGRAARRLTDLIKRMPYGERTDVLKADAAGLVEVARLPGLAPDLRGPLARDLAFLLTYQYLVAMNGTPTDPTDPQCLLIVELAESACSTTVPADLPARASLALARLLQDQPAQARALLADAAVSDVPWWRGSAQAIHAIAEIELCDLVEARRLLDAAIQDAPKSLLVAIAKDCMAQAESTAHENTSSPGQPVQVATQLAHEPQVPST